MAYFCSTAVGTYTGDLGPGELVSERLSGSDTCLGVVTFGDGSAGLEINVHSLVSIRVMFHCNVTF